MSPVCGGTGKQTIKMEQSRLSSCGAFACPLSIWNELPRSLPSPLIVLTHTFLQRSFPHCPLATIRLSSWCELAQPSLIERWTSAYQHWFHSKPPLLPVTSRTHKLLDTVMWDDAFLGKLPAEGWPADGSCLIFPPLFSSTPWTKSAHL